MIPPIPDGQKIAITSSGGTLDSSVDVRFGRCRYFLIVDARTGAATPVENTARSLGGGAGIQAAQQLTGLGVGAVLTGDVGPNAFRVLSAAGVRIFVGSSGTCRDALNAFKGGLLREATFATSPGHHHGPGFGGYGRGRTGMP